MTEVGNGTARNIDPPSDLQVKYKDNLWLTSLDLTDTTGIRKSRGRRVWALGMGRRNRE
jgi:hypothetical protein